MNSTPFLEYLEACCHIAQGAGELLMHYFKGDYTTEIKGDKSPVTDADLAANAYIREQLLKLAPDIPIVAEEDKVLDDQGQKMFWLVDPLDGTRSFVRHETEFSVNIGLVKDGKPLLGVIGSPPYGTVYGGYIGHGSFRLEKGGQKQPIRTRPPGEKVVIARSRTKPTGTSLAWLATQPVGEMRSLSSAIKFCMVAEGEADMYPRFGRTMEWDTAAGHAIVEAAGGRVETADGKPLLYGKPHFENPHFIAYGTPRI